MLDAQTLTLAPLDDGAAYCLVPEGGLREAHDDERASLDGAPWVALQRRWMTTAPFHAALQVCAVNGRLCKPQLRALLNYHCGVGTLRTRQMMMDLQNL